MMYTLGYRGYWIHASYESANGSYQIQRPDLTMIQTIFTKLSSARRAVDRFRKRDEVRPASVSVVAG